MPYPSQTLDVPISGGLAQNTQAELLDPGQALLTVSGLVHTKAGSLQKPPGFAALGTSCVDGASLTAATGIFGYKDELNLLATSSAAVTSQLPGAVFSWAPSLSKWAYRGPVADCVISSRFGVATGTIHDICLVNGYVATLYSDSAACKLVLTDTSGRVVFGPANVVASPQTAGTARLAAAGTKLIAMYLTGASMPAQVLDTSTLAGLSGIGTLLANVAAFDTMSGTTNFYVAYANSSTGKPFIIAFSAAGSTVFSATSADNASFVGVGGLETDTVWLSYADGTSIVKVVGYTTSLVVKATAATVVATGTSICSQIAVTYTGPGTGILLAGNDRNIGVNTTYYRAFKTTAGAVDVSASSTATIFRLQLMSKPFSIGTRPYVLARHAVAAQSTFCVDFTSTPRAVASISPRLSLLPVDASGLAPNYAMPSCIGSQSVSPVAYVPVTLQDSTVVAGIEVVALDYANANTGMAATFQEGVALSGGCPTHYDGQSVLEQGFLSTPLITATAGVGGSGFFAASSTWKYIAIHRHVDGRGQVHRSAPGNIATFTSGGTGPANINVTVAQICPAMTNRTNVVIEVYRTVAGGSTYYLAGTIANPATTTAVFADFQPDTGLQSLQLLYTQPGTVGTALPHVNPPSLLLVITHNDRLFGVEGNNVWYTGQAVIGEAPWWSDAFQFPVLGGIGPLTGMASMDGRLVLFKRNRVFVVDGLGPSDNGATNDLSNPVELPLDVGCINPRSIVVTGEGVWFQSLRGLELLNRSLQLEGFAGDGVADLVSPTSQVLSASLNEQRSRVYFQFAGYTIYRDLTFGTWSVSSGQSAVRGAIIGAGWGVTPVYSYVSSVGQVSQESSATWLVNGLATVSSVETAWLKMGRLQGYQRMRRVMVLGKALASHGITVSVAFDNGAYSQTQTWSAGQLAAQAGAPYWQVDMAIFQQRCQSMRISVSETATTGTGQGMQLLGIGLEYAVLNKLARLPATQKG